MSNMKFIVGYPTSAVPSFTDAIIAKRDEIKEVYFSFGDIPNGRNAVETDGELPIERQMRLLKDLKKFSEHNIKLNLLYNGNCYGADSQSRAFFNKIGEITDYIQSHFGLASVTTSSPLIAKFIGENFKGIDRRASVNMEIGTPEGMAYIAPYFDSFYVKRELNRNKKGLLRMRSWSDVNGKEMYLLANSGCLNFCSTHTFHDNLVSHEAEISKMDNGYEFTGICREFLSTPEGLALYLHRTNFIRPEDLDMYEEITSAVKLATRVNRAPERILRAYTERCYLGSVMELLEPDHSGLIYPSLVENKDIPSDFAQRVFECNKSCDSCNYCKEAMKKAVRTIDIPTFKL